MNDTVGRRKSLKSYVIGGAVGALAVLVVGFSTGWIVTGARMQSEVQQATVAAFAQICESNALASWKQQGKSIENLGGWGNDSREALAKRFAPTLPSDATYRQKVIDSCNDMLRPV